MVFENGAVKAAFMAYVWGDITIRSFLTLACHKVPQAFSKIGQTRPIPIPSLMFSDN